MEARNSGVEITPEKRRARLVLRRVLVKSLYVSTPLAETK
jgi:hypothetical protein